MPDKIQDLSSSLANKRYHTDIGVCTLNDLLQQRSLANPAASKNSDFLPNTNR